MILYSAKSLLSKTKCNPHRTMMTMRSLRATCNLVMMIVNQSLSHHQDSMFMTTIINVSLRREIVLETSMKKRTWTMKECLRSHLFIKVRKRDTVQLLVLL
jgi:hypothetical protein